MPIGLQSSIRSNRLKTWLLILLFPVVLFVILLVVFALIAYYNNEPIDYAVAEGVSLALQSFVFVGPLVLIWGLISFFFHRQMIFGFTGAKAVTRKEEPEIYNIVENLCMSRGIRSPKVGIIEDESMNAFAVGRKPENSWIVFSRGILNNLSKAEIEAVAGHELTHILNKDSLLMVVVIVFIGIIATLGEIVLRSGLYSRSSEKDNGKIYLILIGAALLIVGYLFFPLIQLALSRKREFLADAGSVELTKDKLAMISALTKISKDPVIETIEKQTVAAMCIETPFAKSDSGMVKRYHSLLSTHPSIEERVKALHHY